MARPSVLRPLAALLPLGARPGVASPCGLALAAAPRALPLRFAAGPARVFGTAGVPEVSGKDGVAAARPHALAPLPSALEAAAAAQVSPRLPEVKAVGKSPEEMRWVDASTDETLGYGVAWFPGLPPRPPGAKDPNATWTPSYLYNADEVVAPVPRLTVKLKSFDRSAIEASERIVLDCAWSGGLFVPSDDLYCSDAEEVGTISLQDAASIFVPLRSCSFRLPAPRSDRTNQHERRRIHLSHPRETWKEAK